MGGGDGRQRSAQITLTGSSAQTLQLEGQGNNEVNVNFLMLVPTTSSSVRATIARNGASVTISYFTTQNGFTYQVQSKNHLTDASWSAVGTPVIGDGAVHSVNDTITGSTRFYRVQIQ